MDSIDAELRLLGEDALVTRYVRARSLGDDGVRRAVWQRLVIRSLPRIQAMARTHRFEGGARLPASQHDDAAQEAFLRAIAMGARFKGSSVGEFRAALKTCVWNACMDWGRGELARDRWVAGSLDEPFADGEGGTRFEQTLEGEYRRREVDRLDKEEAEERAASAADLVAHAISLVKNDAYREVLELTYVEKLSGPEIVARLGISENNMHQRRSRGTKEMERILRDLER